MTTHYPPMPRKPSEKSAEKKEKSAERKEKASLRDRLTRWFTRWGADLLLVWGAGCIAAGVGWIFPPAGLIAAGALLITGGVLWARGEGGGEP